MKGYKRYDKNIIYLPRQECGVKGISWHSADTLGHSFTTEECETTNEEWKNYFFTAIVKKCRTIVTIYAHIGGIVEM